MPKATPLTLIVVAVLDPADVHPAFAGGLGLDAAAPGDGLGLLAHVRIERADLRRPGRGHVDRRDGAVGVVAELLHRDRAGEAAAARQRAVVVEEVRAAVEVDDAGVVGEAAALGGHDRAAVGPRPGRAGRGGVADELRAALRREHDVVQAVALVDPGPFLVQGRPVRVAGAGAEPRGGERDLRRAARVRDHVGVELHVPQIAGCPSTGRPARRRR